MAKLYLNINMLSIIRIKGVILKILVKKKLLFEFIPSRGGSESSQTRT